MAAKAYRRILVATDGSTRARRAARVAAALAHKSHARLLAVCVVLERAPTLFNAGLYTSPALSPQLRQLVRLEADKALREVEREARRQGVPCETRRVLGAHAWKSIVGTARRHGCDLIVMGSHGRDAMAAALLGSETMRVLAHSKIPLLVCR